MYTPSFENGSFLKIHLDYQTLKVTSPALSVWPGRGVCVCGGGGMAADSRTMRRAQHQRLNGLCSRRKGRRPFVLSHIQLFLTRASFHNKREFNFNAISWKKKRERKRTLGRGGTWRKIKPASILEGWTNKGGINQDSTYIKKWQNLKGKRKIFALII